MGSRVYLVNILERKEKTDETDRRTECRDGMDNVVFIPYQDRSIFPKN